MTLATKPTWPTDMVTDMPASTGSRKRPGLAVHINRIANGWIIRFDSDSPVAENQWWDDLHYCKTIEEITPILLTRLGKDRIAK